MDCTCHAQQVFILVLKMKGPSAGRTLDGEQAEGAVAKGGRHGNSVLCYVGAERGRQVKDTAVCAAHHNGLQPRVLPHPILWLPLLQLLLRAVLPACTQQRPQMKEEPPKKCCSGTLTLKTSAMASLDNDRSMEGSSE